MLVDSSLTGNLPAAAGASSGLEAIPWWGAVILSVGVLIAACAAVLVLLCVRARARRQKAAADADGALKDDAKVPMRLSLSLCAAS
jgi:hypothetical protein